MADWESIAAMVVSVVFFLSIAGVILLRPISKRLGSLVEAMAEEKRGGLPKVKDQLDQMRQLLEAQHERLTLMEERLDFTENLVRQASDRKSLEAGSSEPQEDPAGS